MFPILRIVMFLVFATAGVLSAAEIVTTAREAAPNHKVIGEVLEFGTFELKKPSKRKANKETPDGYTVEAPGARFTRYTDAIEAKPGVKFGFRFRIRNLPEQGEVVLRTVVRHPLMRLPSGETRDHYETETRIRLFSDTVLETTGYGLDHPFERVPGRWTFEHWYGDTLAVSQSFTILDTKAAAERRRKITARLETWKRLPKLEWNKPLTVEQVTALACNRPQFGVEPGPFFVQTRRRLSGFWSGGEHYEFRAEDAPIWEALLFDETASIYGRMIAAGFLLKTNHHGAKEFLQAQINSFYRRYAHNAAEVIRWQTSALPNDPWWEDRLIELIQDQRLIGGFSSSTQIPGDFRLFEEDDSWDLMHSTFSDVCYALGRMKCRKAVPTLMQWIDSEEAGSAISALGEIRDESVAPELMKRLGTKGAPDHIIIPALANLHYPPVIPIAIQRLEAALSVDPPKPDGTSGCLAALWSLKAKEAIPVITEWAANPKVYERAFARRILAHLENEDPIPALLQLLKDENYEYDQCHLIDDLAVTRSARVFSPLVEIAKTSTHTSVRTAAIRGLGTIGSDESLRALVELSREEFPKWYSRGGTPQQIIAETLARVTKRQLKSDFAAWEKWLRDHPGFPPMME